MKKTRAKPAENSGAPGMPLSGSTETASDSTTDAVAEVSAGETETVASADTGGDADSCAGAGNGSKGARASEAHCPPTEVIAVSQNGTDIEAGSKEPESGSARIRAKEPSTTDGDGGPVGSGHIRTRQLKEGQLINNRYQVIDMIGQGGMGSVYRVEDVWEHQEYALKTLNAGRVSDVAWKRFQKEARAAELLDHPALIRMHDCGLMDEKQPFFVMDFFKGVTLDEFIKAHGPLTVEQTLAVFIQACDGLGYAHKQGVIHRDIKPSNIMIANFPSKQISIKIVDFGIAKVINSENTASMALTQTGDVFGTPFYMSPEQCLGLSLDHRADIYSMGCVMFEALTGLPPFMGDSALSTMMKHQHERPPSLKEGSLGRDFDDALESVIAKMLEKDARMRYQSLIDVANDLRAISSGDFVPAPIVDYLKLTENRRDEKTANRLVMVVASLLVFGSLVALAYSYGRMSAPPVVAAPLKPPDENLIATAFKVYGGDHNPENEQAPKVYSFMFPNKPDTRYFHFPNISLGKVTGIPSDSKVYVYSNGAFTPRQNAYDARGEVLIENFHPLKLMVNAELFSDPRLLTHFRYDEVDTLRFSPSLVLSDSSIAVISHLTGLRGLDLTENRALTWRSVDCLNRLERLESLGLSDAGSIADGYALSKLKRLRELSFLDVKLCHHVTATLEALKGSTKITELAMRMSGLNDTDMKLVTSCKNLKTLDISNNDDLTAKGFAEVANLHDLDTLHADGVKLRPEDCVSTLKNLHHLTRFDVSQDHWTEAQKDALKAALPHDCTIAHGDHAFRDRIGDLRRDFNNSVLSPPQL